MFCLKGIGRRGLLGHFEENEEYLPYLNFLGECLQSITAKRLLCRVIYEVFIAVVLLYLFTWYLLPVTCIML